MWATAPPVEFEIEENVSPEQYVLPLTVEHHMILENAFDELDEELFEEHSIASDASSSVLSTGVLSGFTRASDDCDVGGSSSAAAAPAAARPPVPMAPGGVM